MNIFKKKEEYDSWHQEYEQLKMDSHLKPEEKERRIRELFGRMEYNMQYVGASAIEDMLQEVIII